MFIKIWYVPCLYTIFQGQFYLPLAKRRRTACPERHSGVGIEKQHGVGVPKRTDRDTIRRPHDRFATTAYHIARLMYGLTAATDKKCQLHRDHCLTNRQWPRPVVVMKLTMVYAWTNVTKNENESMNIRMRMTNKRTKNKVVIIISQPTKIDRDK